MECNLSHDPLDYLRLTINITLDYGITASPTFNIYPSGYIISIIINKLLISINKYLKLYLLNYVITTYAAELILPHQHP